eukprot:1171936-Rhodomonas_salina.1
MRVRGQAGKDGKGRSAFGVFLDCACFFSCGRHRENERTRVHTRMAFVGRNALRARTPHVSPGTALSAGASAPRLTSARRFRLQLTNPTVHQRVYERLDANLCRLQPFSELALSLLLPSPLRSRRLRLSASSPSEAFCRLGEVRYRVLCRYNATESETAATASRSTTVLRSTLSVRLRGMRSATLRDVIKSMKDVT